MKSRIILLVVCIFFISVEGLQGQTSVSLRYERSLDQKHKAFAQYASDFLDFAKDDFTPSFDLATDADETSEHIAAAMTLLEIYDNLSCPADKAAVRAVIEREFSTYARQTELGLKVANAGISYTRKPGIAAEAIRMRDDLRELKDLFGSINF